MAGVSGRDERHDQRREQTDEPWHRRFADHHDSVPDPGVIEYRNVVFPGWKLHAVSR